MLLSADLFYDLMFILCRHGVVLLSRHRQNAVFSIELRTRYAFLENLTTVNFLESRRIHFRQDRTDALGLDV